MVRDKRVETKGKGKNPKRLLRPAMLYGLNMVAQKDQKTGDRTGGGRIKDVEIVFRSDKNGQD